MANDQGIADPGEVIGTRYEVVKVLGKGGFGVVYHALSLEHGREFALKTYLKSSLDRKAIARFRQESEIWIALGAHPYLVQAYFADEIDGRLYVGMEMISPGANGLNDLEGYIKEGGLDDAQIVRWLIQLCFGMEYAALRGIRAHRDLKPANVMINDAGEVKVNDFGLATQPGAQDDTTGSELASAAHAFRGQTMHGLGFGTPTHMPPEQFESAAACDARSDIYSVGVMAFQMLTGTLPVTVPWPTDSSLETRMRFWKDMEAAHRSFEYPAQGSVLDPVIARCMAEDANARYENFGALRGDLEVLLHHLGAPSVNPPMVRPLSAKGWLSRGRSLARIGRYAQAVHAFDQSLAADASMELALLGKGDALLGQHQPTKAQPLFDNVLQQMPGHALATAGKARCLHLRGYPKEGLELFDAALTHDATQPSIWRDRGELLASIMSWDDSLASFDRALQLAPNDADSLAAKGVLLSRLGQPTHAAQLFERALSVNPLHEQAPRGQAITSMQVGNFDAALSHIRAIERTGPLTSELRLARVESLSRSGKATAALNELAAITDPTRLDDVHLMRAQVLVDLGRLDDAREHLNQVFARGAREVSVRAQKLVLDCLTGRAFETLRETGPLLAEVPGHEATCVAASVAALHTGQNEQSLQACDYGLSFHPSSAALRYNRGMALALMGRSEEATEAFTQCDDPEMPLMIRQDAAQNAAALRRTVSHLPDQDGRKPSADAQFDRNAVLLRDDFLPLRPTSTIRVQANGWHPRYRLPSLHPAVYLFPRYLPSEMTG